MADLDEVAFLTEPEAAAIYYASNERVDAGTVVGVYDLGGGTFDAAVLEKTAGAFKILGVPEGIERLGGIDFDHAVLAHVNRSIDHKLDELDPTDEKDVASLDRLRHDCVEAKEALSTDTDVSIPVMFPSLQTQVRLTRAEFEAMVRPTLTETIGALGRALRAAGLEPKDLSKVLLVGGSSRIPLVAQMVSAELGRPVAVDAHPKYAIAHGAALAAEGFHREKTGAIPVVPMAASEAGAILEPAQPLTERAAGRRTETPAQPAPPAAAPTEPVQAPPAAEPPVPAATEPQPPAVPPPAQPAGPPTPPPPPIKQRPKREIPRRQIGLAAAIVVAVALIGFGVYSLSGAGGGGGGTEQTTAPPLTETTAPQVTDAAGGSDGLVTPPAGAEFFSRINSIDVQDGRYVVDFETFGFEPQLEGPNKHVHFFFDAVPPSQAGSPGNGPWQLYPTRSGVVGESPFTLFGVDDVIRGSTKMCILVANNDHSVIAETGNCTPLP
jgi:molecular chaperone DnaK